MAGTSIILFGKYSRYNMNNSQFKDFSRLFKHRVVVDFMGMAHISNT